jgi:hypothetical protein
MDKAIQFYLLRVIDAPVGIDLKIKLDPAIIILINEETVCTLPGKMEIILQVA